MNRNQCFDMVIPSLFVFNVFHSFGLYRAFSKPWPKICCLHSHLSPLLYIYVFMHVCIYLSITYMIYLSLFYTFLHKVKHCSLISFTLKLIFLPWILMLHLSWIKFSHLHGLPLCSISLSALVTQYLYSYDFIIHLDRMRNSKFLLFFSQSWIRFF